jgi:hypothetical protein
MASECRRATADIDDDVEHAAASDAHELGLGEGWQLEMKPADHTGLARQRVVVLHEIARDAQRREILQIVGLREEAARVAVALRTQQLHRAEIGLDQLHRATILRGRALADGITP